MMATKKKKRRQKNKLMKTEKTSDLKGSRSLVKNQHTVNYQINTFEFLIKWHKN